jgi:hypothetical protein
METNTAVYNANELTLLRVQVARTAVKNATLAAENRRLKRMVQDNAGGHILHRAHADALTLLTLRFSGYSVARRAAENHMSRRRWHWAIALLKVARVIDEDAAAVDDAFLITDSEDAKSALARAVATTERDGLVRVTMRTPRGFVKLR